jgi:MFS family permease
MAVHAPFLLISILAAIGLCGVTLVRPTQASLLPQLSDTPGELTAANVSVSLIAGAALFLGPATASVVLALRGTNEPGAMLVVALAGVMLLVGAAIIVFVHHGHGHVRRGDDEPSLLGGFLVLTRTFGAGLLVTLVGLQAVAWGLVDVLSVTLALEKLHIGQSGVGIMSTAIGVGSIVGGLATISLVGRKRLAPSLLLGVILWGIPLTVLGIVGAPPVTLLLLAVAGSGITFLDVSGQTLLQRIVSDDALGRVFGLVEGGYMGGWAIGSTLAPLLLRWFGLGWAFAIAGALLPLATLAWWPRLSRIDRDAPLPGPELELVRSIEMFSFLPEPMLERLSRNLREVDLPAGDVVIREGEPGDLFYIVGGGEVRVTIGGNEVTRYGPGHFFGEIALLRDVPRQATVTAVTDVKLFTLERSQFLAAITGSRSASIAANTVIDERLGS